MSSLIQILFSPIGPSPPLLSGNTSLISFLHRAQSSSLRLSWSLSHRFRCSALSVSTEAPPELGTARPSPAEVSRTILELCSTGALSALDPDGWPLGVGARFVVDGQGAHAPCLNRPERLFIVDGRSTFHVQFEQSGLRTPQCTLLGSLSKPNDIFYLKNLCTDWERKFGEELDEDLAYLLSVDKVFLMEDFKKDGVWVTSEEYLLAEPDPLRNCAEKIVNEMNNEHIEDVRGICDVYAELEFQVTDVKIIWVDRLGFEMYIYSVRGVFSVRVPFPREVTSEKDAKATFSSMSHLAWEIEKGYVLRDFDRVKCLKISYKRPACE